jgi:hypothetical protein
MHQDPALPREGEGVSVEESCSGVVLGVPCPGAPCALAECPESDEIMIALAVSELWKRLALFKNDDTVYHRCYYHIRNKGLPVMFALFNTLLIVRSSQSATTL